MQNSMKKMTPATATPSNVSCVFKLKHCSRREGEIYSCEIKGELQCSLWVIFDRAATYVPMSGLFTGYLETTQKL